MSAYTKEQYDTLCAAIAQGAMRVRYGDKEVQYRTLDEMQRIKAGMEQQLGLVKRKTRVLSTFSKGI